MSTKRTTKVPPLPVSKKAGGKTGKAVKVGGCPPLTEEAEYRSWDAKEKAKEARAKESTKHPSVVFSCIEFTLFSDGRIESSEKVERALLMSTFGINDREGKDIRCNLATSLLHLAEHAAFLNGYGGKGHDPENLLQSLVSSLGIMLVPALSIGPQIKVKEDGKTFYDSRKGRMDASLISTDTTSESVKTALSNIASSLTALSRWKHKRPLPGDKTRGSWTWVIQLHAKGIFRETKERPTKAEIIRKMQSDGWDISQKHGIAAWEDKFRLAGLDDLPS